MDAIYMGLSKVHVAANPRKALLVVTDGEDNQSRYTARELASYALEADAQVYTIGVRKPPANAKEIFTHRAALALLENLASQTGGLHFSVRNASDLENVMAKVGAALRDQYMLGFIPTEARKTEMAQNPGEGESASAISARSRGIPFGVSRPVTRTSHQPSAERKLRRCTPLSAPRRPATVRNRDWVRLNRFRYRTLFGSRRVRVCSRGTSRRSPREDRILRREDIASLEYGRE